MTLYFCSVVCLVSNKNRSFKQFGVESIFNREVGSYDVSLTNTHCGVCFADVYGLGTFVDIQTIHWFQGMRLNFVEFKFVHHK